MDRKVILEKLKLIFEDVFELDVVEVTEETNSDDIEEWSSLSHITLIGEVEQAFDMKFTMQEMLEIKSVSEMLDIIEREKK
ncbi:MAG: acyl carrier protein [Lachnospiraceae bacterium]|nr:acyl carrier protein [Lachnospiraceae bacterium]